MSVKIGPAASRREGTVRQAGITLIELMVVVVIIAIIGAIAYPSYQEQVRKSRRTEAKSLLLEAATRQEQFFSATAPNSFAPSMTALGYASDNQPTENGYYTVRVSAVAPPGCSVGGTPCTSFTLTATPQGPQVGDRCGSFTLNELGVRGVSGGSLGVADCW